MSSVLAYTTTVTPRRIAFFRTLADTVGWSLLSGFTTQQVMTNAAFSAAMNDTTTTITSPAILKDMGDEIRTVDSNGFHTASYRRVQQELGQGAEGVGGDNPTYLTYYIAVWSANQSLGTEAYPAVTVARVG